LRLHIWKGIVILDYWADDAVLYTNYPCRRILDEGCVGIVAYGPRQ